MDMTRLAHLDIPFFDDLHRQQAAALDAWCAQHLQQVDHADTDAACRRLVTMLGEGGHLRWCVPAAHGGALPALDSRALVVARETLARHDGLADFAFAMQGLGTGAITLAGSPQMQAEVLPRVARLLLSQITGRERPPRNISMARVALRMGWSQQQISAIERRGLLKMRGRLEAKGLTFDDLISLTTPTPTDHD